MSGQPASCEPAGWPGGTLLNRLDADARTEILGLGVRRRAAPGEVLIRQGEVNSHAILLRDGFAKVTATTVEGYEALLAIGVSGDIVGEMAALDQRPRSATVTSCTRSSISVIHKPDLQSFLIHRPDAALELAGMVAERLRWANQFRVEFTSYPAKVRLARVLVKISSSCGRRTSAGLVIGVELTQLELASLCGAAEATVQKALRGFRQDGLIGTGYRHLVVFDLNGLRRIGQLESAVGYRRPEGVAMTTGGLHPDAPNVRQPRSTWAAGSWHRNERYGSGGGTGDGDTAT